MKVYAHVLVVTLLIATTVSDQDYYEFLGVNRDASTRDIRKAFKKLALTLHPDKNKNDPKANDKFIKLNKAYEILKDEETRKKYDLYGEKGVDGDNSRSGHQQWGGSFKSWDYYYENFGIYDDDPEIITLSRSDFEQSVTGTDDSWFINFYSPACSHCHTLAPSWREMARELDGVIRIGAVNCEEEWSLCRSEEIGGYPTLIMYPRKEKYNGERSTRSMVKYVLQQLSVRVIELWSANFKKFTAPEEASSYPWLIFICWDDGDCPRKDTMKKTASMLEGLVNVGSLDCHNEKEICDSLGHKKSGPYYFVKVEKEEGKLLESHDAKEITDLVLKSLPGMIRLTEDEFTKAYKSLKKHRHSSVDDDDDDDSDGVRPWLIEFVRDESNTDDLQLRKLPALLPNMNVGKVDCAESFSTCQSFYVTKFPTFAIFKAGGGYEVHHGRQNAHDVAGFARDSVTGNVQVLNPHDFRSRVMDDDGGPWFVDFYAPWCPPCLRLLPELRKASRTVSRNIQFGTVDCTVHLSLCQQHNINAYPTSIFYNRSIPHHFHGQLSASALIEFVQDILSPPVETLTFQTFESKISNRHNSEMWLVDFYAPWCGPCQQLAPQWRTLAKLLANVPDVQVGQVDCTAEGALCNNQGINAYPSIRMYPRGTTGTNYYHVYNGWQRDAVSIRQWVFEHVPSVVKTLDHETFNRVVNTFNKPNKKPWVIDFYAPWCGHCLVFAPEFEVVAQTVGDKVNFAKVDCQKDYHLCHEQGITGYPSLRYYYSSPALRKVYPRGLPIQSQDSKTIVSIIEDNLTKEDEEEDDVGTKRESKTTGSRKDSHDEL